jgi:hypothetical protein
VLVTGERQRLDGIVNQTDWKSDEAFLAYLLRKVIEKLEESENRSQQPCADRNSDA